MDDRQGVEEEQEAMGQEVELIEDSSLNLPRDFTDNMLTEPMMANPHRDIWAGFVKSMKYDHLPYLLYFNKLDDCMVLNPRTGLWESMPPLFSPADALRLQHMKLIACDGGFLFFASFDRNEWIVCNPFTKCCGATLRGQDATRRICSTQYETRKSYPANTCVRWQKTTLADRRSFSRHEIGRDVFLDTRVSAGFKLRVAQRHRPLVTTTVSLELKDSRSENWITLTDVGEDFHFLCVPIYLCEARVFRSVLLGFRACRGRLESDILFYDILEQSCRWVQDPVALQSKITLCTSVSNSGELEFLEILDRALKSPPIPFPPPTTGLQKRLTYRRILDGTVLVESNEAFSFVTVNQPAFEYHICLFGQESPGNKVHISVRTLDLVTRSECVTNWRETSLSPSEPDNWPTSNNFHVFRPTDAPCD